LATLSATDGGTRRVAGLAMAILWLLAAWSAWNLRGLYWDGAAFLVEMLRKQGFHDFYPARAHVAWLTQAPVLLAIRAGVSDVAALALVWSACLFALPAGLYSLALYRCRDAPLLLAGLLAILIAVYLPTSFFIVGEYNVAYALATAVVTVALTSRPGRPGDSFVLLVLAALAVRSYEAMVHLGPLLALVAGWHATRMAGSTIARAASALAALGFLAAGAVALDTLVTYWTHPHFTRVRAATFDFTENQQFVLALVALVPIGALALAGGTARARSVLGLALAGALLLGLSPWTRYLHELALVFAPAHYVARTAAGALLAGLLVLLCIAEAAARLDWSMLRAARAPAAARRLAAGLGLMFAAACVPDLYLTTQWSRSLDTMRGLIAGKSGAIAVHDTELVEWPGKMFVQDWTMPALSRLLHRRHGEALLVMPVADGKPDPYAIGRLPPLDRYLWR